jgi:hypothetical protein
MMRRTSPEEAKRTLIIILVILLLLLAFLGFVVLGIPLLEKARTVIPATYDTVASHEDEKISILGRLSPGSSVSSSTSCSCGGGTCSDLDLIPLETEGSDYIFDDLEVYVEMKITYSAEPGHFYVPSSYTYEDFRVYTTDGQELKDNAAIRVIGTVEYVVEQYGKTIVKICPDQILVGERDCSKLVELNYYEPDFVWKFPPLDRARIIHVFSNRWSNNLPEFKFFLPAGESASFEYGGGTAWIEQPGCPGSALPIYQNDPLREITLEEYQKYIEQKIIP